MTAKYWNGTSYVDIVTRKYWNGTSWVDITTAKYWNGTSWVDVTFAGGGGGLSATININPALGDLYLPEPAPTFQTVTSSAVTVTATGGTGPYLYSWTKLSGDGAVHATTPTAATTTFHANIGKNQEKSAIYRCTITDAVLATTTVDVSVIITYETDA